MEGLIDGLGCHRCHVCIQFQSIFQFFAFIGNGVLLANLPVHLHKSRFYKGLFSTQKEREFASSFLVIQN